MEYDLENLMCFMHDGIWSNAMMDFDLEYFYVKLFDRIWSNVKFALDQFSTCRNFVDNFPSAMNSLTTVGILSNNWLGQWSMLFT